MPVIKPIMLKLLSALYSIVADKNYILFFKAILIKAIFLLAFHAVFRHGELVIQDKEHISKVLQRSDLMVIKYQGIQINLDYFFNT